MKTLGTVLFVGLLSLAFACWVVSAFNLVRVVMLRKPGVSMWHDTWLNPFNLVLQPNKLTDKGKLARKRCFLGVAGFLLCCASAAAIHITFGLA